MPSTAPILRTLLARRLTSGAAFAAALLAGASASAAALYWDGGTTNIPTAGNGGSEGGSGDWSTAVANWDPATIGSAHVAWPATGVDNDASFGGAAGTVTLQMPISVNDIAFTVSGYTITGSAANPINLIDPTATPPGTAAITVAQNHAQTISATIAGATTTTLAKAGAGKLTLTAANTYTGPTTIAGVLNIQNGGALGTADSGTTIASGGALQLQGGITVASETLTISGGGDPLLANSGALRNIAGNNSFLGQITLAGNTRFTSDAGLMTLGAIDTTTTAGRSIVNNGAGDMKITGTISGVGGVFRDSLNPLTQLNDGGTGTTTLSGANTFTGASTLAGGTLRLDYSLNDNSKFADAAVLTLGGGVLELSAGTHVELVGSTTLNAGSSTTIRRVNGGTATISLNAVTAQAGSALYVEGTDVVRTNSVNNAAGILGFNYRVLSNGSYSWGTNATGLPGELVTAFAGYTDVNRQGGVIPSGSVNVRIIDGGAAGNITPGASPLTQIYSLQSNAPAGPARIAFVNGTDVLNVGDDASGAIWQTAPAGALTIGNAAGNGVLTTGATFTGAPATLTLINDSTSNALTINSAITNNVTGSGTEVIGLQKTGPGTVILNGRLSYTGATAIGSGNATAGVGGLTVITGNNPGLTGNIFVGNGATLQLQSNGGNTVGGIATVIGTSGVDASGSQLGLSNGSRLELRSDTSVTFGGTSGIAGLNGSSATIDIGPVTAATNKVITISPGVTLVGNAATLNLTGASGYALAMGTFNNVTGTATNLTINPISVPVSMAGYTSQVVGSGSTLTLSGTQSAVANTVTGTITNGTGGAVNLTKLGTSTWDLQGPSTNTGNMIVRQGVLTLSGYRSGVGGTVTVADTNGLSSTLNIQNGSFTTSTFVVGSGDSTVSGVVNQTGGFVTVTGTQMIVGNNGTGTAPGSNATGTYNLSGGTLAGSAVANRGVILGVNTGTTGIFNLSGTGVLALGASVLQVGRSESVATNSTGIYNQSGGAASIGTLLIGGGAAATNAGTSGTMTFTGGFFQAGAFTALSAGDASKSSITIGGSSTVFLPAFPTTRGANSTATLVLDGGVLGIPGASATYMTGLTSASLTANGGKIAVPTLRDSTIAQPFINAAGATGSFTKMGVGALTMTGTSTYSGSTSVLAGVLNFSGATGSANLSSSISLSGGGTLQLTNAVGASLPDRIKDSAPITMTGGTINFSSTAGAADYSETLGAVTLAGGNNTITASQAAVGQFSTLTLASVVRSAGATVNFTGTGLGTNPQNSILIASNPTLSNGIIGPWATYGGTDLASYDPTFGVTAYTGYTDIDAMGSSITNAPAANVRIFTAVGTGNDTLAGAGTTNINTLLQNTATVATFDVSAAQTLQTGAIIVGAGKAALTIGTAPGTGTLSAATAGGELTLTNLSTNALTINSVIANNSSATALTTSGSGTTVLAGDNTYTGVTNIGGNLQVGAGGATGTLGSGAVINNGTLSFNRTGSLVVANAISGVGGLTQAGAGTIFLTGTNSYSGTTTIKAGAILNIASVADYGVNSAVGNRPASLESISDVGLLFEGGTLQYTGSTPQSTNRQIRLLNSATNTIDASGSVSAATLSFTRNLPPIDFFENGGTRTLVLTGTNTGSNTLALQVINQATSATSITKTGTGTWVLAGDSSYTGVTTISGGLLRVTNPLGLGGTGGGTTVAAGTSLELANNIVVGAEPLSIIGSGLNGTGALRNLSGINTFGGPITLTGDASVQSDAGTLTLNSATAAVTGNFNLTVAGAASMVVSTPIATGTGALTKTGPGVLTLSAANTYTGATSILAGGVVVSGSIAGAVSVGDATSISTQATLGGVGTVGAVSTIGSGNAQTTGATIDPGNVIGGGANGGTGTLTTGNFSVQNGAHLALQIGATAATGKSATLVDRVNVVGAVDLTSADLQLSLFNAPTFTNDLFTVILNDGTADAVTGLFTSVNGVPTSLAQGSVFSVGSQFFQISYRAEGSVFDAGAGLGNDVALMAVPEPTGFSSLLGGLGLLVAVRRFRRGSV